jgi:hypothetical protein
VDIRTDKVMIIKVKSFAPALSKFWAVTTPNELLAVFGQIEID